MLAIIVFIFEEHELYLKICSKYLENPKPQFTGSRKSSSKQRIAGGQHKKKAATEKRGPGRSSRTEVTEEAPKRGPGRNGKPSVLKGFLFFL